jgi:acetyl esterase
MLQWKDQAITVAGAAPLAARWYAPPHGVAASAAPAEPPVVPPVVPLVVPLVVHLHGGAFAAGGLEQGTAVASLLAQAGASVLSLAYPLAPAHPFPAAALAVHASLLWAQQHRRRFAASQASLFIAGEEAGGNLAATTALMARDRRSPPLAGQILLSPMLDPCVASASWRDAQAGRSGCACADGWRAYLPRPCDARHPYAAPSLSMRLDGLPPTLLITATDDPLRDEALAYARRLREAGVAVSEAVLRQATGWPHSYLLPLRDAPWADKVRALLQRFLHDPAASAGPSQE